MSHAVALAQVAEQHKSAAVVEAEQAAALSYPYLRDAKPPHENRQAACGRR